MTSAALATAAIATDSTAVGKANVEKPKQARADRGTESADGIDRMTTASVAKKASFKRRGKGGGRKKIHLSDTPKAGNAQKAEKTVAVASGGNYDTIITRYASSYGVPVSLAHAVIRVESNYRPTARGSAGEIGLMQIKPATARMMGYNGSAKGLFDPDTNIRYGMKYLAMAHQLGGGDTCGTILRYNAGHAAKRMNRVSRAYCDKVLAYLSF